MSRGRSKPLVSVIVPCFNAEAWIRDTLRSVAEQDLEDVEVVVVDDGSTDASASIVEGEFERVALLRTPNLGASHARNLGTRKARGSFLQYLDADDVLAPGKLRAQLCALKATNGDVAYGGWQVLQSSASGGSVPGYVVDRQMEGEAELALFTNFWCPPAAYLFRREVVERVGAWNEKLPIIQDARFALDCALRGAKFVYCPG